MNIKWVGSPNFDTNRKPIKTVTVHWIVGNLAAADAVFAKPGGVSAHYGVEDGEIHQYVSEEHVAYHAGVYAVNQESIGIEHSAAPDRLASDQTYQTSGKLIAEISQRHNIPLDREHVIKHSEVKATQCPGTMDLDRLMSIAKSHAVPMVTLPQAEVDKMRLDRDTHYNNLQAEVEKNKLLAWSLNECQNKPPQIVEKEVVREVPVEVIREVEKIVIKEVIKEIPEEKIRKLSFSKKLRLLFQ